jgi:hypothetical protein
VEDLRIPAVAPKKDDPILPDFQYCLCGRKGVHFTNRWWCNVCWEFQMNLPRIPDTWDLELEEKKHE